MTNDQAEELRELARRAQRLTVSRRDPERFFVEREEISAGLRRMADSIDGGRRHAPCHTWRS